MTGLDFQLDLKWLEGVVPTLLALDLLWITAVMVPSIHQILNLELSAESMQLKKGLMPVM
jgi:hypothetical protein